MLKFESTRTGGQTVAVRGMYLHSSYDPEKEARRFIERSSTTENPGIILLLGAGLGYVVREIQSRYPSAQVIVLFYDQALSEAFRPLEPVKASWHPGKSESLISFLRSQIHEIEAEALATVEWPPSTRIYPAQSLQANQAVRQLLKELRGSLVTTAGLGRRWLKNSLINFICIDKVSTLKARPMNKQVIIAASGPSLQRAIRFIADHRDRIELWALPSSLAFLIAHELVPDLTILTDPSYFAISHLHCARNHPLHLLMPLSAAGGAWQPTFEVSYVSQDFPFELPLLQAAGLSAPSVAPQGTVAATAMFLALRSSDELVVFAGLDFCYRDISSHVRPNNFENWLLSGESRLSPLHHLLFSRSTDLAARDKAKNRSNLALSTYAGWFSALDTKTSRRVRRLYPSEVDLPRIEEITESELSRLFHKSNPSEANNRFRPAASQPGYPNRERREKIVFDLLARWKKRGKEIETSMTRRRNLDSFFEDPEQLSLSYFFDAAAVAEMRRALRLQGAPRAVELCAEILRRQVRFLETLAGKLRDSG